MNKMIKLKTWIWVATLAVVVASAQTSLAQDFDSNLYAGVSGSWNIISPSGGLDSTANLSDDMDVGWDIFVGYRAHKYLGLEVGHTDLGDANGKLRDQTFGGSIKASSKGWLLRAVGFLPILEKTELTGQVGVLFYDTDVTTTPNGGSPFNRAQDGTAISTGVGVQCTPYKYFAFRLGYEHYFDVEDVDIDSILFSIVVQDWSDSHKQN